MVGSCQKREAVGRGNGIVASYRGLIKGGRNRGEWKRMGWWCCGSGRTVCVVGCIHAAEMVERKELLPVARDGE